MKPFFIVLFFILVANVYSQSHHLIGDVDISIDKGTIEEKITITNFYEPSNIYEILLNNSLKINSIHLNNDLINFKVDTTKAPLHNSNVYHIELEDILKREDSLKLDISGTFKIYNEVNKDTNVGNINIASNYGVLKAAVCSYWYPQIQKGIIKDFAELLNLKKYQYDITLKSKDCEYIHIGDERPSKSPCRFNKEYGALMLLAGNFKWTEKDNSVFINIDTSKIDPLLNQTQKIKNYYETLLNEPIQSIFSYAKLYTDDGDWAFNSKPTIVFMKPKGQLTNVSASFLSHEIAHNYFGYLYIPKTNLYWFYLESFAEYFSFKYQIATHNTQMLQNKYFNLKITSFLNRFFIKKINGESIKFVRLSQVKNREEITGYQRYNISPFQLLGI